MWARNGGGGGGGGCAFVRPLTTESVEGPSLSFEGVDDVHGRHGLPLGVFRVGHRVPDDVLQENLQHAAGLFVYEAGYSLDASAACQATYRRLGDTLDVVPQDLAVTFRTPLS